MDTLSKPKCGVQINPLHPLSRGLVACFLMNEGAGSLINDISGNKNHGRLKNMEPNKQGSGWGGSKFGGSLKFDGVDDYVNCGDDASLDITDAITVSAWVKTSINLDAKGIVDKVDWDHDGYDLSFDSGSGAGKIRFVLWANDALIASVSTPITYGDGEWHHIVGTVALGEKVKLYVDNVLTEGNTMSESIGITANDFRIGRLVNNFFNGPIDSVRIYNRALSAEEVRLSYEQPFCMMMKRPILLRGIGN